MTHLILENVFPSHQKVHLYVLFLIPVGGFVAASIEHSGVNQLWFIIASIVSLFLAASIIFSKKGFAKRKNGIVHAYYCWGKYVGNDKIEFNDRPVVTILKFKRRQKTGFISAANPDLSVSYNAFDIYLLNTKHTKKDKIMSLKSYEKAQEAIRFLTKYSSLKFELYSPDFN